MSQQIAALQYATALKRGKKYYKTAAANVTYRYPQVLEDILDRSLSAGRMELGLVEINACCYRILEIADPQQQAKARILKKVPGLFMYSVDAE